MLEKDKVNQWLRLLTSNSCKVYNYMSFDKIGPVDNHLFRLKCVKINGQGMH